MESLDYVLVSQDYVFGSQHYVLENRMQGTCVPEYVKVNVSQVCLSMSVCPQIFHVASFLHDVEPNQNWQKVAGHSQLYDPVYVSVHFLFVQAQMSQVCLKYVSSMYMYVYLYTMYSTKNDV